MEPIRQLAPSFIGSGTVSNPRDMVRALETLEALEFTYIVDEHLVAEGTATLVKIMADLESATMAVNGCLFLNVASFRYLEFEADSEDRCVVRLYGDGAVLTLRTTGEADSEITVGQMRLIEESEFDLSLFVSEEDEE